MQELVRDALGRNREAEERVTKRLEAIGWLMAIASFLFALGFVVPVIYDIWKY